ncbi:melanocortin receptor 4-like [Gigantopelta aegis]|uniref:melanocortin receptor 4-like n=1 Tax=Gigantopelta aegis TaxID=1735272 RepID=UPI001B8878C2|nr:melanocortin receptor 4-like [Gigantopelta aegis]
MTELTPTLPSNDSSPFKLAPAEKAARVTIGMLVFVENGVSLYALRHAPSVQTSLRYSLTSLSIANVLCGLVFTYHSIVIDISQFGEVSFECWMRHIVLTSLTITTLATVATLILDRTFALFHPFGYRRFASRAFFVCTHVLEWLLSVLVTTTAYAAGNDQNVCHFSKMASMATYTILSIVRCSLVVIIVTSQVIMFCLAKRHITKIVPNLVGSSQLKTAVRMNIKAIMTTSAIVLPFVVCVTPLYLGYFVATLKPDMTKDYKWKIYLSFAISILMVNGAINPAIYCWRLPEVRRVLKRLCCNSPDDTTANLAQTVQSTIQPSLTTVSNGHTTGQGHCLVHN